MRCSELLGFGEGVLPPPPRLLGAHGMAYKVGFPLLVLADDVKMKQMKANLYKGYTIGCTTRNTAMCRNSGANSGAKDGDGTTEFEK